jgi:hypothetical protein
MFPYVFRIGFLAKLQGAIYVCSLSPFLCYATHDQIVIPHRIREIQKFFLGSFIVVLLSSSLLYISGTQGLEILRTISSV